MNASPRHFFAFSAALLAVSTILSTAMADGPRKKNPSSKFYVADIEGESQINTGERIEDLTKKSVHHAQGTIVETKKDATNAMVFSNGTGIFFDSDTKLEVKRFSQEPFTPNRTDMEVEPSISQTNSNLSRGTIGLCTSKMVAGSIMTYRTMHASVAIRGKKVVIETNDRQTTVSLLEGDVTVRGGEYDQGGQNLRPGQQAIITGGARGGPTTIQVQDIPPATIPDLDRKVTMACMAKNTVYFETTSRKNDVATSNNGTPSPFSESEEEIVAIPVNPANIPVDLTVSAARIGKQSR
jgi:FecR protein